MAEGFGVHNPKSIGLITQTPNGEIVLVMIEERSWDGDDARLLQLQDKINCYLAFALDGQLVAPYPQAKGKRMQIRLDCAHEPDSTVLGFVEAVQKNIPIALSINVR